MSCQNLLRTYLLSSHRTCHRRTRPLLYLQCDSFAVALVDASKVLRLHYFVFEMVDGVKVGFRVGYSTGNRKHLRFANVFCLLITPWVSDGSMMMFTKLRKESSNNVPHVMWD